MFTVTFYSFKGGVGRTLALMNVAVSLAMVGKRVLIVDFDLEAPGVATFPGCATAQNALGLVDYVNHYLDTGLSREIGDFIHEWQYEDLVKEKPKNELGKIHILPAGGLGDTYSAHFGRIDWKTLYDQRDGYLLIEDMKAQWKELGFDYVLIDSRTGHTDASGICTRQLPDVVVCVFFPNDQNLIGLKEVVSEIRHEQSRTPPELIFVASRLPRLDDEDNIVSGLLERFKKTLDYKSWQVAFIHHYDSLALLEQEIFVASRPRTNLAKEYLELRKEISLLNISDPRGASLYLRRAIESNSQNVFRVRDKDTEGEDPFEIHDYKLNQINDYHKGNSDVMHLLATHYYLTRKLEKAANAIDSAIVALNDKGEFTGINYGIIHDLRVKIYRELGDIRSAKESVHKALAIPELPAPVLLDLIRTLIKESPDDLPEPSDVPGFASMPDDELSRFASQLDYSRTAVSYAGKIVEYYSSRNGEKHHNPSHSDVLALIGSGKFDLALEALDHVLEEDSLDKTIILFNRAMALWAKNGVAPKENFSDFLEHALILISTKDPFIDTANFNQCLALAYAVINNSEEATYYADAAKKIVTVKQDREFSCWRYREVIPQTFEKDCEEIKEVIKSADLLPIFIREARKVGKRGR